LTDLVKRSVDHPGIRVVELNESHPAVAVAVHAFGELPPGYLAETCREPINTGEGGEGVVDGRRESADRNFNQLVNGKDGILHEGPVWTGDMGLGQC
jgi:hypothetical protein